MCVVNVVMYVCVWGGVSECVYHPLLWSVCVPQAMSMVPETAAACIMSTCSMWACGHVYRGYVCFSVHVVNVVGVHVCGYGCGCGWVWC
jgi:hypothetical protein